MTTLKKWRWVTLIGYFGLLTVLLNWFTWVSPPTAIPRSLVILMVVAPLLLPLHGLLHEKRRSHQWSTFLALPYFIMGVDYAYNQGEDAWLGAITLVFSLIYWTGATFYSKYAGPPRKKKKTVQDSSQH